MNLFLKVWIHYYIVFYPNLQKWSSIPLFPSTLSPPRTWMPVVPGCANPAGCISKTILTTSGGASGAHIPDVVGQAQQRIAKRKRGVSDSLP
jgi:hypothetical protein